MSSELLKKGLATVISTPERLLRRFGEGGGPKTTFLSPRKSTRSCSPPPDHPCPSLSLSQPRCQHPLGGGERGAVPRGVARYSTRVVFFSPSPAVLIAELMFSALPTITERSFLADNGR